MGDGQLRGNTALSSGQNCSLGVAPRRVVQLVDDMAVGAECERRAMAELAGDVDHAAAFVQ